GSRECRTRSGGGGLGRPASAVTFDEPGFQREPGQLRDGPDPELPHEALAVCLDGPVTDAELAGDLLVRAPAGDAGEHFALASGERFQCAALLLALQLVSHGGAEPRGDRRAEE